MSWFISFYILAGFVWASLMLRVLVANNLIENRGKAVGTFFRIWLWWWFYFGLMLVLVAIGWVSYRWPSHIHRIKMWWKVQYQRWGQFPS